MSTRTQAFVLLLFAAALLRLGSSDMLLRFVRESARPWVLVAGAAILVLGLWSLAAAGRDHGTDATSTDEHGHGAASRSAWLVTLPVVAVLVIGPPALGEYTANRRDPVRSVPAGTAFGDLPRDGRVLSMRVFDFALRALGDGRRTLVGRTVALTGFVARPDPDGFLLARLVITCCAADASPVTVRVRAPQGAPAAGTWVRVTGTYAGQDPTDADVPVLRGLEVQRVAAPAEPYD